MGPMCTVGVLRPVAARGCLPPGANVCVCRPRQSDQICNQGIFRISEIGVCTNFWGLLPFAPFLFPPLPSSVPTHLPILYPFPLNVGP